MRVIISVISDDDGKHVGGTAYIDADTFAEALVKISDVVADRFARAQNKTKQAVIEELRPMHNEFNVFRTN